MRQYIKRFYTSLPLIREVRYAASVAARNADLTLRIQQERFYRELASRDKYVDPRCLTRSEHQIYSQTGEDGIIAEIFRRIGTKDKTFLELGVENGLETNTTFLLSQGWSGTWIEGSPKWAGEIWRGFKRQLDAGRLRLVEAMVTRENVASLVAQIVNVDLLSVDVDLNTYYVWEGLAGINARLIVVEYNGHMPAWLDWKAEYSPDKWWDGSKYYGASLKAYELLGERLGYALVGCNLAGINAFFVRKDLLGDKFLPPYTAEQHYEPDRQSLIHPNRQPSNYTQFLNEK